LTRRRLLRLAHGIVFGLQRRCILLGEQAAGHPKPSWSHGLAGQWEMLGDNIIIDLCVGGQVGHPSLERAHPVRVRAQQVQDLVIQHGRQLLRRPAVDDGGIIIQPPPAVHGERAERGLLAGRCSPASHPSKAWALHGLECPGGSGQVGPVPDKAQACRLQLERHVALTVALLPAAAAGTPAAAGWERQVGLLGESERPAAAAAMSRPPWLAAVASTCQAASQRGRSSLPTPRRRDGGKDGERLVAPGGQVEAARVRQQRLRVWQIELPAPGQELQCRTLPDASARRADSTSSPPARHRRRRAARCGIPGGAGGPARPAAPRWQAAAGAGVGDGGQTTQ
jgi:hypothetical protein